MPSIFSPATSSTSLPLPHLTWSASAKRVLGRFSAAAPDMSEVGHELSDPSRFSEEDRRYFAAHHREHGIFPYEASASWHLPLDVIDGTLYDEMLELAASLRDDALPEEGAAVLVDLFDEREGLHPRKAVACIAWLRAALVHLHGDRLGAMAVPTVESGSAYDPDGEELDGSLPVHADLWVPAYLLTVLHHVTPGHGATTLMPMADLWGHLEDYGMPADRIAEMQQILDESGSCDSYVAFAGRMYEDDDDDALARYLQARALRAWLPSGHGYLLDDRRWLHGRTALPPHAFDPALRGHRIYRLAYNTVVTQRRVAERNLRWRQQGYAAIACK